MQNKRYFEVPSAGARGVKIDSELYVWIQSFAEERKISMAEAIHLLTGPAVVASEGGDYMKPLIEGGFLQERTPGVIPNKRSTNF